MDFGVFDFAIFCSLQNTFAALYFVNYPQLNSHQAVGRSVCLLHQTIQFELRHLISSPLRLPQKENAQKSCSYIEQLPFHRRHLLRFDPPLVTAAANPFSTSTNISKITGMSTVMKVLNTTSVVTAKFTVIAIVLLTFF